MKPIRIGISSCLLGQKVRWDGGHKKDSLLLRSVGRWAQWVPVCPEAEAGMGIPREPVHLVVVGGVTRMRGLHSGEDWTARMRRFASGRLPELGDVCGYVFKKDSPSCGVFRARPGLFAQAFQKAFPLVPVEEEGRLSDPRRLAAFVRKVLAYDRLRGLSFRPTELAAFHADHGCELWVHSPDVHQELGDVVARARELPRGELRRLYSAGFMKALARPPTRRRQAQVLEHFVLHLEGELAPGDRAEVARLVADHRAGRVPLSAARKRVAAWVRLFGEPWLKRQTFLVPDPREEKLAG